MPRKRFSPQQAVQTAMEVEDNGIIAFLRFARQTTDMSGKNMFIRLAMDEHEHRRILEKQLKKLVKDGKWQHVQILPSEIERLRPSISEKQQRTKGESGLAELDALQTALDLEKKSAKFYKEQAQQFDDAEAKTLFLRLAEWEEAHFDIIQAELDSIQKTGFWFGIPEFQMDGKF